MIALSYILRDDGLHATTLMRSNNAYRLVPYNLFETSLLAEVIASEVGSTIASLTHYAISMHLYDDENDLALDAIANSNTEGVGTDCPRIDPGSNALEQVSALAVLESKLRYAASGLSHVIAGDLLNEAANALDQYWLSYFAVLVFSVAIRQNLGDVKRLALPYIHPYFIGHMLHEQEDHV